MPFVPIYTPERSRTNWDIVTHVRLNGRRPTTKAGLRRWAVLNTLADADRLISIEAVLNSIEPERNLGSREKSIRSDLRCYSNAVNHGNNDQNKGWMELGHIVDHSIDPETPTRLGSKPMTNLTIPASPVKQGDLVLYATSIAVRDLIAPGFYSVETLDPDNANDRGFQRLLNTSRAKKLADYIVKGQDTKDAFLPTSVFLATDKMVNYDAEKRAISFDVGTIGAFSVVDGQHRLEGLRMAAEKDARVLDFEVPVNIAVGLPRIAQMCHFLIVNTTQKSVDKSVEQRIVARLTAAIELEDIPSLPKWILNTVQKGEVDRAVRFVDFLNSADESPWYGKIKMANDDSETATVNQRSFVKSIVKYVLTANNPLTAVMDLEKEKKIFLNYWKAIANLLDDGNAEVLYKYNGVELFCKFSIPFFMKLQDKGSYTVSTMISLMKSCFDNMEGEYAGVTHPEWWARGSSASFLNAGAINHVSQELSKALHKSSTNQSIEV